MTHLVEIPNGKLFLKNAKKADLIFLIKAMKSKKNMYGVVHLSDVIFPRKYIGKRLKIKLEFENGK